MIGESNPETWKNISELLNGMSFQFSLEKSGPMLNNSVQLFVASLILLAGFFMLRWQILRTAILGMTLLSLAYLICAVLLLIIQSPLAHAVALSLLAILFIWGFLVQSNLLIYWHDSDYTDIAIEVLVALGFLFFIGRMLFMALGG